MSREALVLVGQFLAAILGGGVLVAIVNNFLSPKTKAETRSIAQKSAQETIDAALNNLRADLEDARAQIRSAISRADAAETKADEAEAKMDAMAARDRIILDYLWRLMRWSKRWYDGGHPPGMEAPPEPPTVLSEFLT